MPRRRAGQHARDGVGVQDASRERSLWSALSPSVAVAFVPTPRLALWLACEGLLAFNRPRFLIENGGEVWRGGRGGLRVVLGIEVRFRAKNSRRP
ncbi:hypothetical protein [Nannocystis radixulma]|uniref:Uncharacterized protein n=1 Tax=Nannocystis radixulma TaxID=2995305 RepID=A0ABT5B633_9BACT|nr:hypothetical protein [Nannocystis radixulma]MDC0668511.1 hypothetical protein [Nannocystis radixulma]